MSLNNLYKLKKKQDELESFAEELKENPIEISKYKQMVVNSDFAGDVKHKMLDNIQSLQQAGMLKVDDVQTWEDFISDTFKNHKGYYPLRASDLKQSDGELYEIHNSIKTRIYYDIPRTSRVQHYSANHGTEHSGKGCGVDVRPIDSNDPHDRKMFNEANERYHKSQERLKLNVKSILEGRKSGKYEKYAPLSEETKEKYGYDK